MCLAGLLHVADWWVHRALRLAVAVNVTARDVTNAMFTCQRQANPPGHSCTHRWHQQQPGFAGWSLSRPAAHLHKQTAEVNRRVLMGRRSGLQLQGVAAEAALHGVW